MYIDEISFCTIYIIMYSILVKQVMRIKNLERVIRGETGGLGGRQGDYAIN